MTPTCFAVQGPRLLKLCRQGTTVTPRWALHWATPAPCPARLSAHMGITARWVCGTVVPLGDTKTKRSGRACPTALSVTLATFVVRSIGL